VRSCPRRDGLTAVPVHGRLHPGASILLRGRRRSRLQRQPSECGAWQFPSAVFGHIVAEYQVIIPQYSRLPGRVGWAARVEPLGCALSRENRWRLVRQQFGVGGKSPTGTPVAETGVTSAFGPQRLDEILRLQLGPFTGVQLGGQLGERGFRADSFWISNDPRGAVPYFPFTGPIGWCASTRLSRYRCRSSGAGLVPPW
jgi:hypothetical protein